MHSRIRTQFEPARGCGFRKVGGIYLTAGGPSAPCGRLPIPLGVCPTCGGGIHPSRGWTWVNGTALVAEAPCSTGGAACGTCPLGQPPGRVGLLWIGESFYSTPADWSAEAVRQGVSRRIASVPRGFALGKTWVWVAHRRAIANPDGTFTPGVFHAFRPTAIEIIVDGTEPDDVIEGYLRKGWTPVRVIPSDDYRPFFDPRA